MTVNLIGAYYRFRHTLFFLYLCLIRDYADSLSTCTKTSVVVWDNVLCAESRAELHRTASRLGSSHHFLFKRPIDPEKSGLIERTLDSILTEMDDDSEYVEFWTRQEWRSIAAHADVDEMLAKSEDAEGKSMNKSFRFPKNGHVLYLQIGDEVRGPTCVFPGRQSGGELLKPTKGCDEDNAVKIVIVPAVPGRLLRFQGDFLHAVPRPHDLWFRKFIQGAPSYSPEEKWGRSVILFNTWGEDPPLDVKNRTVIPEDEQKPNHSLCEPRSAWEDAHGKAEETDDGVCVNEGSETEYIKIKIWLLGNERRRSHQMRTIPLMAPESLATALQEESNVRKMTLRQS